MDQRVMVRKILERVLGDMRREAVGERRRDLPGESTSILDLNSPMVVRNSFLFCDWMSLLTLECFSTNLPSSFDRITYN